MLLGETRVLPANPETVAVARRFVVDGLRAHDCTERCVEDAALLTTELATNAVEHAGTPYMVVINLTTESLRIDVVDQSVRRPTLALSRPVDELGGRGLLFVAVIADGWGVDLLPTGKSVWFELAR